MATNINKLRGKIKEHGLTQEEFAKLIGVDPSTLSRKMALDGLTFTVGEMHTVVSVLELSKDEATQIFLS